MKIDVIIGNPPYQTRDGGAGASASPIYQHFVTKAKQMQPRYLTMIIPARWYSGGKRLDAFRDEMLHDAHIRVLHDFPDASLCFRNADIAGGVCYFLWDRDRACKTCKIISSRKDGDTESERPLFQNGETTFIRFNEGVEIANKVKALNEGSFGAIVSTRKPFGAITKTSIKESPPPRE